jgi:hypothetical protein
VVEYRDRFDTPSSHFLGSEAASALTRSPAQPRDAPQIIDRFNQPQQAGAVVGLPGATGNPGSGMPDLRPPPAIAQRNPAWPTGSPRGDGTFVQQQQPGTVSYDANDPQADNFGGDAGPWTTLKASLVPETSPENVSKKLRIYARDMGIPENRFFIDKEGNAAWIDMKGSKHLVVPTVGGGDWKDPTDKMRRFAAQSGNMAGSMIAPTVGGATAAVAGPAAGAAAAAGADALRQIAGNWVAGEDAPWQNLSYSNMAWQAAGVGATELAGQIGSALVTRFLQPGNPYNLRDGEIKQLQAMMGKARGRAGTAGELGMDATPYDLTDLEFLRRLEQTVSKQPGVAGDIMKQYYDQRSDFNFPASITNLFKRISPEGTPLVGLDKLQRGAESTIAHIRDQQVSLGTQGGWGEAIASGARPDARAVVAEIQNQIEHTSGPVKQELQRLLGEMRDGTTLVTDFERLHNIRLDMEGTLDGFRRTLPPSERGRMTEVLDPIFNKFNQTLEAAHPGYAQGTKAYQAAGKATEDIRDGVLTLLSQNPDLSGNMGKALFKADPETVEKARKLFIAAGQGDNWNAGVRAVLQDNLTTSSGPKVAGNFANKTVPFDANRQALNAALPEAERTSMDNTVNLAKAQGRVVHPPNRAEVENVRLEDRKVGYTPISSTIRAALGPFRFTRELGDELVDRAFNGNATRMAERLIGADVPKRTLLGDLKNLPGDMWRDLTGRKPPPPPPWTPPVPSTGRVLQHLENTAASPFEGWKRHAFERAIGLGGAVETRGLLDQPTETLPTAPDLQRGLLLRPLH